MTSATTKSVDQYWKPGREEELESTRATCDKPYHAQIKPDLIYGQQKARISEMIARKLSDKIG